MAQVKSSKPNLEFIKSKKFILVAICLVVIGVVWGFIFLRTDEVVVTPSVDETPQEVNVSEEVKSTKCVVHVDGAVASPGVVECEGESIRVGDAVKAAGGLTDTADTTTINLAAILEDGSKVYIPHEGEDVDTSSNNNNNTDVVSGGSGGAAGGLVNINTASVDELTDLPGVGPSTAQAIVDERQSSKFSSVEDLMRVTGIGEKKFNKLKDKICV